jgi:membrane protein Man1
VWVGVWLWGKWAERAERQRQAVFELVEQVLSILFHQHQMIVREGKPGTTFLAIDHIRDQLIAPSDRKRKAAVWAKVVQYIRNQESRVREDIQHIFGEEFRVWQWLPDIPWSPVSSPGRSNVTPGRTTPAYNPGPPSPPPDEPPHSTPTTSTQWPQVPTTIVTPGWQGSAFQLGKHVAAPVAPPTSCLKVRHLFDTQKKGTGWVVTVKEEIVRRCHDAQILHIAVDTESVEGTVYIKTTSPEDAGKVFRRLHGQWYRGQLVTAKYLRLERYHERFPDARNISAPIKCSK